MKRLISFILFLAMLGCLSTTCLAAPITSQPGNEVLGTLEDDEGYPGYFDKSDLETDIQPALAAGKSLRFSFTANEVYDLLTTRFSQPAKTVTLWASSDDYEVTGQPHFTPRPTKVSYCRAGLCYYSSSEGLFRTDSRWYSDYFSDESGGTKFIERKTMTAELTYYGFCKNTLNEDRDEEDKCAMRGTFYVYNVPMY